MQFSQKPGERSAKHADLKTGFNEKRPFKVNEGHYFVVTGKQRKDYIKVRIGVSLYNNSDFVIRL